MPATLAVLVRRGEEHAVSDPDTPGLDPSHDGAPVVDATDVVDRHPQRQGIDIPGIAGVVDTEGVEQAPEGAFRFAIHGSAGAPAFVAGRQVAEALHLGAVPLHHPAHLGIVENALPAAHPARAEEKRSCAGVRSMKPLRSSCARRVRKGRMPHRPLDALARRLEPEEGGDGAEGRPRAPAHVLVAYDVELLVRPAGPALHMGGPVAVMLGHLVFGRGPSRSPRSPSA